MKTVSPSELLRWQINHYSQRLSEEKNMKARAWLRNELFNLKRKMSE